MSCPVDPAENDAPLLVYANAVQPPPFAPKSPEPIPRRRPEIEQGLCSVQHVELAESTRHDVVGKGTCPTRSRPMVEVCCRLVAERGDHGRILSLTQHSCNSGVWLHNGHAVQLHPTALTVSATAPEFRRQTLPPSVTAQPAVSASSPCWAARRVGGWFDWLGAMPDGDDPHGLPVDPVEEPIGPDHYLAVGKVRKLGQPAA